MDFENYIPLKKYAELQNVEPATVRQKILRGNLEAVKIGRDWFIKKDTPYTDKRVKSGNYRNWRKNNDE